MNEPAAPCGLVLVGPRAAGKTTLGRALASRLSWGFRDGDDALAERVGEPAGAFLRRVGEAAFRAVEAEVTARLLAEPTAQSPLVLALGGGAVLAATTERALRDPRLFVVFVVADPDTLTARLATALVERPALTKMSHADEVREVLRVRRPVYERVARACVDTTRESCEESCSRVLALLAARGR